MKTTRREFLCQTATGTVALGSCGLRSVLGKDESSRLDLATPPIVDTHQHLWDLTKVNLPWLTPGTPLCRSFVMQDYLKATQGVNLTKSVYMEVAVTPEDKLTEAEYVLELCRQTDNPTVAAVIGFIPGSDGFCESMARFKGSPYIKGVRHIPRNGAAGQEFLYLQKPFIDDIRLLGEMGKRFDLCPPPQHLPEAIRLVDKCPDVRFICDHCGNADPKAFWSQSRRDANPQAGRAAHEADQWRRDMGKLAERKNVVCKISGIVTRAPKDNWLPDDLAPIINHCLEVFGPDRAMFASDWPVCTRVASLREWVAALNTVVRGRSEEQRRKLFGENAVRFYELG